MSNKEKHIHETFSLHYPTHDNNTEEQINNLPKPAIKAENDNSNNKGGTDERNNPTNWFNPYYYILCGIW